MDDEENFIKGQYKVQLSYVQREQLAKLLFTIKYGKHKRTLRSQKSC